MILNLLGLAFFAVFWVMAARGLMDASGPFTRRLTMLLSRRVPHRPGNGVCLPAQS